MVPVGAIEGRRCRLPGRGRQSSIERLRGRCALAARIEIEHAPKVLELEDYADGRLRLVLTLSKLNQVTKLDFLLSAEEAGQLADALRAGRA